MAPPESDRGGGGARRKVLLGLALGQFVSLLITSTGFSSSELARRGINAPTSQSLLNYILLALVYGGVLIYRRQPLTIKWYNYLILGIIDVEANYIVVKSYQYTSLTSVMLLDCWSIPCVIVLTWIFLKTKYGLRKFIGVGVCVAGLILVVFSDVHASDRAKGPNPLKGDLLVIFGSMLYACSNVTEEYVIKKSNRVELMAMLGLFGAVISGIQISILERHELHSIKWNAGAVLPFLGFAVAMFLFYSTVPTVLKICGATMLNLSLLTSDMWAVLIRIFAYHEKVRSLHSSAHSKFLIDTRITLTQNQTPLPRKTPKFGKKKLACLSSSSRSNTRTEKKNVLILYLHMARSTGSTLLLLAARRLALSFTHTSIPYFFGYFSYCCILFSCHAYMILFLAIVLTTEIPSRGSKEAEEKAQVAGAGDNQVKVGDEEAGMHNRV